MQYPLSDVHTHYDETVFDADRTAVLNAMRDSGVQLIVNSGSSVPSSRRSVELARSFDFMRASVGVFPLEAYTVPEGWLEQIEALARDPKVVAIGEIGLDYFQPDADREAQKRVFEPQLELAARLGLPVVIHDRDADEDMLDMLRRHPVPGMIHRFFSQAQYGFAFLDMGLSLGIGPAITYPNAGHLVEVVRAMPLDRLLLETDCPFLPTCSHEGQRATSDMLAEVAETIARVRGDVSAAEVASIALSNAKRLFHLDGSL